MSRNGPMGQLGLKMPLRRPGSEESATTQPLTPPPSRWPLPPQAHAEQQGYAQSQGHGQQQGQQAPGYFFPQTSQPAGYPQAEPSHQSLFNRMPPAAEAGHGYAPSASSQPLPFNRFPQQAAEPDPAFGYPPQGSEPPFGGFAGAPAQQQAGSPPWGQQQPDQRGYDLNNYMAAPGQGYAQEPAQFPGQQDPALFGAPHGYAETDADYDETLGEDDEPPSRGRRGLMIVAALVGAIGLGGGMAYTYKTVFASRSGPAPVIKDTQGPSKSRPEVADGRGFPHTDKKLLNRLGEDANQPSAPVVPAGTEAADDRQSDDPNAPRRVRIIPISPGGPSPSPMMTAAAPPPAAPAPMVMVPGVTLENMGPRPMPPPARVQMQPQGAPPSAARAELPPQAAQAPVRVVQPPVRVASATNTPVEAAPAPAKKAPVAKERAAKSAVPKTKEAAVTTGTSGGAGYVAVLSSQKTRMDALTIFADMQQKYGDVLASKTPDVQEANLGDKGIWYRAVVGPPGSREAASGLCSKLKSAGYTGCWVTTY